MWEIYIEHPVRGKVVLGYATSFEEVCAFEDVVSGCTVKYISIED